MNSSTLGSLLLLAATAAASPFSLVAFSMVLATARGPKNGIAFICGWITTVTLIGVGVAVLGSSVDVHPSRALGKWILAFELAFGVALILLWIRRRFRPPEHREMVKAPDKPPPAWERKLSSMGYVGAFVAGGAVQTWPVMIAAAAEILRLDVGGLESLAWMFAFAVVTTAGIVILEVLAWRSPSSAAERLDKIRNYVASHRDSVINWLYLLAGLWLFFRGLLGLV